MYDKILTSLSYGMFAVGVRGDQTPNACIVNTVIQISSLPMTIAVSINHSNYTNECIKKYGEFTVSVLSENTSGAAIGALGYTSGRDGNKLSNVRYKVLREGAPVIQEDICCWFLCRVVNTVETVTHTIFIAEPVAGSESVKGKPMTYDFYRNVIKGKSPKFAPTYIEEKEEESEKYVCTICKYEYSDSLVPFEELPDDWVCPICGAPKSVFRKEQ
ncbi:MAG: flavin reductase [Clostridia bacterium]|nr:flavin reductase [Clostridia bacterium]MBR2176961.1 flavin reductase [Clostridia bacterium]